MKYTSDLYVQLPRAPQGDAATAIQSTAKNNEQDVEARSFIQAITTGLADLVVGRELSFDEAMTRLGLK